MQGLLQRLRTPLAGLALAALAAPLPLMAQDAPPAPDSGNIMLLDTLLKNGVITQAQYDQLVAQEKRKAAAPVATVVAPSPPPAEKSGNGIALETPPRKKNDDFTLKIGGRIHADYGFADSDKTKIGSAQEMRRLRFDISGTIYQDWAYMLSYDFAASPDDIKNAYVSYIGFKDTELTVGYFKEPFSLEYQTSNKALEFNERSMLNDSIDPPKRMGLGYFRHSTLQNGSEYTAAVGLFGHAVPQDTDEGGNSGVGVAGRATYVPFHEKDRLFHIGIDGEWRHPGDGEPVGMSTHPNAHFASSLIDTGPILNVDNQTKLGGELAGVYKRLSMQAQYDTEKVKRSTGPDLTFNGWYAQASLFLTDDSRAPAYENGSYGTIKPHGKYGAWQIGLRYDTQNLTSHDIVGGEETNVDAALNWYVNRYLRFSVNYVKVIKLDRPGDPHDGDKPTLVIGRMWIGW
ncbi:MAG TPA: porin [Luteibacter sp.]|nr:porin [Luteibacter sp.]